MFCKLNKEGLTDYPELWCKILKVVYETGNTIIATYNRSHYYLHPTQIQKI